MCVQRPGPGRLKQHELNMRYERSKITPPNRPCPLEVPPRDSVQERLDEGAQ